MKLLCFQRKNSKSWCKLYPWFLAFSWCAGLVLGALLALNARSFLVPMICGAAARTPSVIGLFAVTALPFLLSAYAVFISEPRLMLILSALKAMGFGFCACGVSLAFGSAGWLVRFLFLFSDFCGIPALYVFWLRYLSGERRCTLPELGCWVGFSTAIGIIDLFFISPFLAKLILS